MYAIAIPIRTEMIATANILPVKMAKNKIIFKIDCPIVSL